MRSVTVRIRAAEFSATMTAISEWLDANRYKPTRYKYDHDEDVVLVTVDFTAEQSASQTPPPPLTASINYCPELHRPTARASRRRSRPSPSINVSRCALASS